MEKVHSDELFDLGDAVVETKGTAPVGDIDLGGGFRQKMWLSDAD